VLASLINGEPDEMIPVSDRGFHYGDGVFETVRIANRQATLWPLHQKRLDAGCDFLNIPLQLELLEQDLQRILMANEPEGIVKIILSRGSGGRGYQAPENLTPLRVVQFFPLPEGIDDTRKQGARVKVCNHPLSRNHHLVRFKHLCRIDQVIASSELSDAFSEGIMQTEQGQVVEGTRSNLFLAKGSDNDNGREKNREKDRVLITPALDSAGIKGVMREYLLDRFADRGIAVLEQEVDLPELLNANEIFLCNSVVGVMPITELVNGEVAKQLQIGQFTETAGGFADEAFAL